MGELLFQWAIYKQRYVGIWNVCEWFDIPQNETTLGEVNGDNRLGREQTIQHQQWVGDGAFERNVFFAGKKTTCENE